MMTTPIKPSSPSTPSSRTPLQPHSRTHTLAAPSSPSSPFLSLPSAPPTFIAPPNPDHLFASPASATFTASSPPFHALLPSSPLHLLPALSSPPVLFTDSASSSTSSPSSSFLSVPARGLRPRSESVRAQREDGDERSVDEQPSAMRAHSHLSIDTRASSHGSHVPSSSPVPAAHSPPLVQSPPRTSYGHHDAHTYLRPPHHHHFDASSGDDTSATPDSSKLSPQSLLWSREVQSVLGLGEGAEGEGALASYPSACSMCEEASAVWWCVVCRIAMCQRDLEQPHTSRFPLGHRLIPLYPQRSGASEDAQEQAKKAEERNGIDGTSSQAVVSALPTALSPFNGLHPAAIATAVESQLHQEVHAALQQISQQRVVEERLLAAKKVARLRGRSNGRGGPISFLDTPSLHHRFLPVLNKADLQQHWESLLEDVQRLYPLQDSDVSRQSLSTRGPSPSPPPSLRVPVQEDGSLPLGHLLPVAPRRIEGRSASAISPTWRRTVLARLTSPHSPMASPLKWTVEEEDETKQPDSNAREREASQRAEELSEGSWRGDDDGSAQDSANGRSASDSEVVERESQMSSSSPAPSATPSRPPHRFYHSKGDRSVDDTLVSSHRRRSLDPAAAASAVIRRSMSSAQLSNSVFIVELPSHPLDLMQRSQSSPPRQLEGLALPSEDADDSNGPDDSQREDSLSAMDDLQEVGEEVSDGGDGQGLPPAPIVLRSVQSREADGIGRLTEEEDAAVSYVDDRRAEDMRGGGSAHEFDSGVEQSDSAVTYSVDDAHSGEASEDSQRADRSNDEPQSEELSLTPSLLSDGDEEPVYYQAQPVDEHSRLIAQADGIAGHRQTDSPLLAADTEREEDEEDEQAEEEDEVEDEEEREDAEGAVVEVEEEVQTPESLPPSQEEARDYHSQSPHRKSPSRSPWSPAPSFSPSSGLQPTPLDAEYHARPSSVAARSSDDFENRSSPRAKPTLSPLDDADLNDALWIMDDDEVEQQQRTEQEARRPPRRPHPSLSPLAAPADNRRGHRVLLSAFHRVLNHLDEHRPWLSAPMEDDVQLVARLLQRLLDGPVDRWRDSTGFASSLSSCRSGSLRERDHYDGYGRAGPFTASGSASFPRVSPPEHRRPRASPPVQPVSMMEARRALSDEDLLRAYPSPPLVGLASSPLSHPPLHPPHSPLIGSPAASPTPLRATREPRHARRSHCQHGYHTTPQQPHSLQVPPHPQRSAASHIPTPLKTPKAPSHPTLPVHPTRATPASSHALNASHGALSRLTRRSPQLPHSGEPAAPVPHVIVTGPRAISVRLEAKSRKERLSRAPSGSVSILQAMEEQNRRGRRQQQQRERRGVQEADLSARPHRIDLHKLRHGPQLP